MLLNTHTYLCRGDKNPVFYSTLIFFYFAIHIEGKQIGHDINLSKKHQNALERKIKPSIASVIRSPKALEAGGERT